MQNIRQHLITPTKKNGAILLNHYQAIDCSWHLPNDTTNGKDSFMHSRLPKARFFDIDLASAPNAPYPHTLPAKDYFLNYCQSLGLSPESPILLYDKGGVICAFRVWYMLREFGFKDVHLLDGGLRFWVDLGLPLETTAPKQNQLPSNLQDSQIKTQENDSQHEHFCFTAHLLDNPHLQIIDARAEPRFLGQVAEPRPGVRPGHMPGAKNIPYLSLFKDDGCLKNDQALKSLFDQKNIDLSGQITTTCGSGVTASIVAFALECVGAKHVKIYDGSWAEWGARHDLPIAQTMA